MDDEERRRGLPRTSFQFQVLAGSEAKFTFQIKHKVAIWPIYALFFSKPLTQIAYDAGFSDQPQSNPRVQAFYRYRTGRFPN